MSWEACSNKAEVVTCVPEMDRCSYANLKGQYGEVYSKGCQSSLECDSYCVRARNLKKCRYYCCSGELCNYPMYPFSSPTSPSKGQTCYKYYGKKSDWKDNRKEVRCSSGKGMCMEASIQEYGEEVYITGCVSEEYCLELKSDCKNGKYKECEIQCCQEKECNKGGLSVGGKIAIGFGAVFWIIISCVCRIYCCSDVESCD